MNLWNNEVNDNMFASYATRYIASWCIGGGSYPSHGQARADFREWLKSIPCLNDEERHHIDFLAGNGKMELESDVRRFLAKKKLDS